MSMSLFCLHKNLNENKSVAHYLPFKSVLLCLSQFRGRRRAQALSTMYIRQMKTLAVLVQEGRRKDVENKARLARNPKLDAACQSIETGQVSQRKGLSQPCS